MISKNVIVPREPNIDMIYHVHVSRYPKVLAAAPQQSEEEMIELVARAIYATESPWTFDDMARAALKALGLIA